MKKYGAERKRDKKEGGLNTTSTVVLYMDRSSGQVKYEQEPNV